jgi:hypothetical protein
MRGRVYGIYAISPDIQTDLYHATIDFGNRRGSVYRWDFIDSDYDIRDVWQGYYSALSNVNNFLDNIDKITGKNDEEKTTLANLKGEAYFFRAFFHEKLVKRYAKDYEPASAASDPGIPLVLHFELNGQPARATVEEVYTQILSDLKDAKALIKTEGKAGSERLTKDCIAALEAIVYLDLHRYGDAVTAANSLINSGTYPLVDTQAKLLDVWAKDANDESILMLYATSTELGNANSIFLQYSTATGKYTPDFVPEQWLINLYDDSDFRKKVYFAELPVNFSGMTGNLEMTLFNKFPGNPALYTGTSNYQHKPKVFRIAEAHLIKAEALAWDNKDAEALAALNVLRKAHGGLPELANVSGDALKNEIKNERIRELVGEGTRLSDLKRWKQEVTRGNAQNVSIINEAGSLLNKPITDAKFVWAIPSRDMTTNPNLVQNPGWE